MEINEFIQHIKQLEKDNKTLKQKMQTYEALDQKLVEIRNSLNLILRDLGQKTNKEGRRTVLENPLLPKLQEYHNQMKNGRTINIVIIKQENPGFGQHDYANFLTKLSRLPNVEVEYVDGKRKLHIRRQQQ